MHGRETGKSLPSYQHRALAGLSVQSNDHLNSEFSPKWLVDQIGHIVQVLELKIQARLAGWRWVMKHRNNWKKVSVSWLEEEKKVKIVTVICRAWEELQGNHHTIPCSWALTSCLGMDFNNWNLHSCLRFPWSHFCLIPKVAKNTGQMLIFIMAPSWCFLLTYFVFSSFVLWCSPKSWCWIGSSDHKVQDKARVIPLELHRPVWYPLITWAI